MTKFPYQASSRQSLTDSKVLRSQFGEFDSVKITEIDTSGYSGAKFSKMNLAYSDGKKIDLILKRMNLDDDWFSSRSNDVHGREAKAILSGELSHIHHLFELPYHIISIEERNIGILMNDISSGLFPDEKKSIHQADQDLMLDKLAEMHAYYWESQILDSLTWLNRSEDFIYLMGPLDHEENKQRSSKNLQQSVETGWESAMKLLPEKIKNIFLLPASNILDRWSDLPLTLIHGDSKVANFAKSENGQLCLFDWAFVGHAPCTFELGWFLGVNASRLAESKEELLLKYRKMLEKHLGHSIDNLLWSRLEEAGIVCGAFMLLWSKGAAVANNQEGAVKEWNWWLQRLENWAKNF